MSEREPIAGHETSAAAYLERRTFVRLASDLEATCRLADGFREVGWPGRVRDVSRGGIGLIARHHFQLGTELAVELRDSTDAVRRVVRVKVVHVTATSSDGAARWMLGCAFDTPLTEEELEALR
ncbi:MAG: PilZ domain-containing protein [Gemmataceae bacterium]